MKKSRLKRNFFTLSSGIFLSRILGYIRDLLIALWIGGRGRDIFFISFLIPNLSRRLLGEGALNSSFVPIFSKIIKEKGKEEGNRFTSVLLNYLILFLLLIVFFGIVFSPYIIKFFAPGFSSSEKIVASQILRIMFPFALFICLASFFSSYLTTLGNFLSTSLSFLLFNLSLIFFLTLRGKFSSYLLALSFGVAVGGLLQLLVHFPFLKRKFSYRPMLKHSSLPEFGRFLLPASFGASIFYLNTAVDRILASFLPSGSISALYYSNRLIQFPLALTGIAMSMVSLPLFSLEEKGKISYSLSDSLKWLLFLTLPFMFLLSYLGEPIIRLLFQRGEFTSLSTQQTYSALLFYSLGLFFFSSSRLLRTAFYSFHAPWLPVKFGIWSILINILFDVLLMKPLKQGGLALATSISSFAGFLLLLLQLIRKERVKIYIEKEWMFKFFPIYLVFISLVILLSLVMGNLDGIRGFGKLILIVGISMAFYTYLVQKFGVMEIWSGKRK